METEDFVRRDPPLAASELEILNGFLDYHRATLLQKVEGVSDEDLRRRPTVSSLTLLGLVKHVAYVERWWFQAVFAGRDVSFPWSESDPDAEMRIEPHETTADILNLYKAEVREARSIVAAAPSLEVVATMPGREHNLRWVIVHLIEETARHNGHADLLRELIDGVTGE